jgi:S-adenosylmethionine:tRNA ribosyltransferase-isomerase
VRLSDLDYDLPSELIAQRPLERRDASRMLVVERSTGALHDQRFTDLARWLRAGDALVLNETRVRPARLRLRRPTGGRVELLIVRPEDAEARIGTRWRALARPAKRATVGAILSTESGDLRLEVIAEGKGGERLVRVAKGDLDRALSEHGETPLPPYIHRAGEPDDRIRYQTVYARVEGAVAAPTAGLHFTEPLLEHLGARGVSTVRVLLHVGPGTFRPVTDDPSRHRMDEEYFEVPAASARELVRARAAGGRIVAVGTTAVRALESACDANHGHLREAAGWTRKFIVPPYTFQAVDALITNFHLPRTTLLLLVAAFVGESLTREAYAHAVAERYRFYSYGDAMLVV